MSKKYLLTIVVMKKMEKETKGEMCMCGNCQNGGMWGHHHWGHMVIKIFIVMFIFWAGVQFGELKAAVENYTMGGMGGYGNHVFFSTASMQPGMMGNTTWAQPAAGTITVTQLGTTTRR